MPIKYTVFEWFFYLYLYAVLSWGIEVCCFAVKEHRFLNRGFLNLPVNLPCGVTAAILILVLPTLGNHWVLQTLLAYVVYKAVRRFADQFVRNRRRGIAQEELPPRLMPVREALCVLIAAAFVLGYHLLHPLVLGLMLFVPEWVVELAALSASVLVAADYVTVRCAVYSSGAKKRRAGTKRLAARMAEGVWRRLEKAYPGIWEAGEDDRPYVFARGICHDKLIWVFLVSSFLGALIEMAYCWATGGGWMNRSSVLYGAFSFVWGLGAVVLTVVLQRIAQKADRWVFLAGFVVGGVYEYLCSVFTEVVFGTVFWDYSQMPMNIGGRTNVVYCVFWGLLAVVWIKIIYPPMSAMIERIPVLPGKAATWVIVVAMAANGLLTAGAMIRYADRRAQPEPENAIERFLDARYDDDWMQARWPNMKFPE